MRVIFPYLRVFFYYLFAITLAGFLFDLPITRPLLLHVNAFLLEVIHHDQTRHRV